MSSARVRRQRVELHRAPHQVAAAATLAAVLGLAFPAVAERDADLSRTAFERQPARERHASAAPRHHRPKSLFPEAGSLENAWEYAAARAGPISIGVIDSRGRFHGYDAERPYPSASISKVLLLAAELRRLDAAGSSLDGATRALLARMITLSDNDAADAIYARVGDAGLYEVARAAGMESFGVAGYWAEARITAADMARLMWHLEDVFAGPERKFALGLLGSIVSSQRWGIPAGAGEGWNVRFKGGWRPTDSGQLDHQAAELRRDGERLAIAVLSDGQPSHAYATETMRGIADRLIGPMSSEPWDGRWR